MNTIWEKDAKMPRFDALDGNLRTDVLVIGGGLAGLLCAYHLQKAGVDCALIEENRLMSGVSGRTTAKLTSQHGLIYKKLLDRFGPEKARLYYKANEDALGAVRSLAKEGKFDFEIQSSFLYSTGDLQKLEKEMDAYERLKIPARWQWELPLHFPVTGAVEFLQQAQFHPMKLAAFLAKDLNVYEDTKALAFLGNRVETPKGSISAEKIIVATHFPLWNKHGAYFLKLYQQRSYVLALKTESSIEGMYLDCEDNGLSVRGAGPYLLLGGGGHRTGKEGLGWKLPEQVARKYYRDAPIVARWATQDCMTLDGMPYIGKYSKATPDLYVATGFGKWGMSSSMVAARVLTELVQDRKDPYGGLFSPQRSMLYSQLATNGLEATANLLRFKGPRCPHMGCALHWNKEEHSWDCACHGSRFSEEGKRLNNPATNDLKKPPHNR